MDKSISQEPAVPENIDTQYDIVAQRYIDARESSGAHGTVRPSTTFLHDHLKESEGKVLVDIGCGGGEDLLEYRNRGFLAVEGVESSPAMIEMARKLLGGQTPIHKGTWRELPLQSNTVDCLVGRLSLHYEENLDAAYREAARVLKSGGKLIVVVPHPEKAKSAVLLKKNGREYVYNKIFDGAVPIVYPRHEERDYFSRVFSELFELEERVDIRKMRESGEYLDQMGFVARKR